MRVLGVLVFVTTFVLVGALFFGQRVVFDDTIRISAKRISADPRAYLAANAAEDIQPSAEKEIIWADPASRSVTPVSIVYLHGFSATMEEIRPLPESVAQALGANVFFTHLTGHGRGGAALAEATVNDWINDTAEALEIGHALGERVLIIASSTGGTLAALAAEHPKLKDRMDGVVFISPNFGFRTAGADLLTAPFAQTFVPAVFGEEQSWSPTSKEHARWWMTSYPTRTAFPVAATVKAANAAPYDDVTIPALFVFPDADEVGDQRATRRIAGRWGGAVDFVAVERGATNDPSAHVIADQIMSPGMTSLLSEKIVTWARKSLQARGDRLASIGADG